MKVYFIGGLGCNSFYPQDLLLELPFEVAYIDLYQEATLPFLENLETLALWFEKQVDLSEDVLLIAHSLGADLAVALAARYKTLHLILVDGGFLDMGKLCSLEEELAEARMYLEHTCYESLEQVIEEEKEAAPFWTENLEQAVRTSYIYDQSLSVFRLNLSFSLVKALLRLRRQVFGLLSEVVNPSLLILPELGKETPNWKKEALALLPEKVRVVELADCGHSLYTEKPREVGEIIVREWEKVFSARHGH
ncbi:alpha/beta fold hydrolase [Streptococcus himalayensis]|uniref:Alpha/beta hydrolase n=1 Tax=Streptococcus himalayensis TaxID=1888195 RepID=A0A917AAB6_9STRE|nr:alpha/beta hydrolase [Streptococcus himalayensis]GGE37675.1 alpha/beta hydrolase [Streptococcus himalayensis]